MSRSRTGAGEGSGTGATGTTAATSILGDSSLDNKYKEEGEHPECGSQYNGTEARIIDSALGGTGTTWYSFTDMARRVASAVAALSSCGPQKTKVHPQFISHQLGSTGTGNGTKSRMNVVNLDIREGEIITEATSQFHPMVHVPIPGILVRSHIY